MLEALPLEEHLSGLDVELLNDPLPHHAAPRAADGGEIPWHRVVDRDQCGVLRADEELVVVPVVAVGGRKAGYLTVGTIEDHILAWCLPPGKYVSTLVGLHLKVKRAHMCAQQGTEPHDLPAVVEDHRAALPSVALLRGDEDIAGGGLLARLCGHLDCGWAKVGA